ncbi:MAG TPA: kynureninase [Bacillota bacterium]|nr:kynureninase [Bacillota bacterium]
MKEITFEDVKRLDEKDELRSYRDEFYIREDTLYMDGNSLGLMSKRAEQSALAMVESWKEFGIDGWQSGEHPWFYVSEKVATQMAPLVGAKDHEIIVTGSTTVNLHQILTTFYKPTRTRYKIVADTLNFPTDTYAIKSHLHAREFDEESYLKMVESKDGTFICEEDIIASFSEDVAIAILPSVWYRSGQILDMKRITEEAHAKGVLVAFDLSHSAGSIPHHLHDWNADFAFWCTYKHLNGGPGAVGAMFVHENHLGTRPGLAGWFGSRKEKQFDLEQTMTPAGDAGAFQIGTPHVLNIGPLIGSLSIFTEVGIYRIREKSLQLTSLMIELVKQELHSFNFTIANPLDDTRGGHVYLEHAEAARICKALKSRRVIPDFRAPSGIRLAPVALYNSFTEVWDTVHILKEIMEEKMYEKYTNERDVIA